MLKLLSCARGHFWESAVEPTQENAVPCPECGAPADELPLLDLAPDQITAELPPPVARPVEPILGDDGKPNVGGYEILEDLGRAHGKMRRYRARQLGINREVLLEVVLAKEDTGQHAWSALRGEASALGKIDHPNVVQIHDVGERDRQLFYNALELVSGPTLGQKASDKPLPLEQVMRVVELLARAVDHAHNKGILHRNLRPSRVLLQPVDGSKAEAESKDPAGVNCQLLSAFYVPKLIGFGLARKAVEGEAIDSDLFGDEIGYLSPEQVWGRAKDLGPTTDVYGLGGILYYLLAGRPPFRGPSYPDVLDAIQTAPLAPPSSARSVPADLEAICRKALGRSPRRRYASAAELADDLRRAQQGKPVSARTPSRAQRLGRWMRRRPGTVVLLLLLLTACVMWLISHKSGQSEAEHLRRELARSESQRRLAETNAKRQPGVTSQSARLQEFLNHKQTMDHVALQLSLGNNQGFRNVALDRLRTVPDNRKGFEWQYLWHRWQGRGSYEITDFDQDLTAMAFGPHNGRLLATAQTQRFANRRSQLRTWDVQTRTVTRSDDVPGAVVALALSPDGTRLAAAAGSEFRPTGGLRLFALGRDDKLQTLWENEQASRLSDVAFGPGGDRLAFARANGTGGMIDPRNQRMLVGQFGRGRFGGDEPVRVAVGPNHLILCVLGMNEAWVYHANGAEFRTLTGPGSVQALALAELADGNVRSLVAAVGRSDESITINYDFASGGEEVRLTNLGQTPRRLAFSPDGTRLAAAFADGQVRVWAYAGGVWVEVLAPLTLRGPETPIALAFSSNGKALAVGGGRKVIVWGVVE